MTKWRGDEIENRRASAINMDQWKHAYMKANAAAAPILMRRHGFGNNEIRKKQSAVRGNIHRSIRALLMTCREEAIAIRKVNPPMRHPNPTICKASVML